MEGQTLRSSKKILIYLITDVIYILKINTTKIMLQKYTQNAEMTECLLTTTEYQHTLSERIKISMSVFALQDQEIVDKKLDDVSTHTHLQVSE